MTKHFLRDLGQLSDNLLRLTAVTEDALADALSSILSRDEALAQKVIDGDAAIDQMEVKLEEDALKILALHAPVAGDLRFLIAAIKINNDLERIADIAVNIAKRAKQLAARTPLEPPHHFPEMASRVRLMVRHAIQALVRRDPRMAQSVRDDDDAVDDYQTEILQALEDRLKSCERSEVDPLLRWSGVVRNLERAADLATNIAEDVQYMTDGAIVRHEHA